MSVWLDPAARALTFSGVLLVIGAWVTARCTPASAAAAVLPRLSMLRRVSLGILVTGVALRLVAQARGLVEPGESVVGMMWTVVSSTTWGRGWVLQALATAACLLRPTGRGSAVAVALLALTPALTGHAVATPTLRTLAVCTDWLHVLAAGTWLGTLTVIVVVALPALPTDALLRLIRVFSPIALVGASLAALTGVVSTALHVPSVSALVGSGYGRLVLLKAGLFGVAAAVGAINWRYSTPRLATGEPGPLTAGARAEAGVAAVVLLVTVVLVATELP